jgi:RNA polymerase sigma-70 factor (ECF subfamily)
MLRAAEILDPSCPVEAPVPENWAESFYRGDNETMTAVYCEHFGTVRAAVGQVVVGADCETVIHEVFYRLLSREETRRGYQAGNFASWIYTVAKHQAIDYARRHSRERPTGLAPFDATDGVEATLPLQIEARALVARFRATLPPQWQSVFDVRFLGQVAQRTAANELGIPRTTLAYRELRIRHMLRAFLRSSEDA